MTAQNDLNTQVVTSPTGGTVTSGPAFPTDNPVSDTPVSQPFRGSGVSPYIPTDSSTQTNTSDPMSAFQTPVATQPDPVVVQAPDTLGTAPAVMEEKEEKLSPLEALAKKLSELKAELIQDAPSEDSMKEKIEQPVVAETKLPAQTVEEMKAVNNMPEELPIGPALPVQTVEDQIQQEVTTMVDNTLATELSSLPVSQPLVEENISSRPVEEITQVLETPSLDVTTPQSIIQSPALETPVIDTPPTEQVSIPTPSIQEPVSQATTSVDDILSQYQSEIVTEPQVEENGNVIDNSSQETISTVSDTNSDNTIDESNKNAIDSEKLQASSTNTKYPLSISKVLDIAIERDASDVLISVGYPVMVRVDGSLVAINEHIVSPENSEELVYPVLSDQKKELLEVNREVDLAYTHQHDGEARFRINAFYTRENLAAAFRLIPTRIKSIEELKLPQIYNQFANLKQGLVLVTGPTGHGKSTTLAAILQTINTTRSVHMLTIEDPIEYIFPKAKAVVDQREMHDDTHSWTVALKSALRQNPDVILVGEMRDYETISSAITLAETGHLVFATLHTNSASQSIDRIIDVFPENQQAQVRTQLASILEAVVAQRLIPLDGGGRRAVSEILIGNPAIRNLIREGKTHQMDNVIRTGADVGMISLEHSLVKLVREGLITMDKAQEYAVHPEEVVRLLKG